MLDILETLKYNGTKEKPMNILDFVTLLSAMLRDEVEGTISTNGNSVVVTFENEETRTITVT